MKNLLKKLYNYLFVDEEQQKLIHKAKIPYRELGQFRRSIRDEKHITYSKDYLDNTKIYIIETIEDKYGDTHENWELVAVYEDKTQILHYHAKLLQYVDLDCNKMKLVWRKI